jgi:MFS family permease
MRRLRNFSSSTFRSMRVRNFRYYFIGQSISLCGTAMQTLALSWLVLQLSGNDGFAVGTVVALQFLPTLLFGAWGGVIADRFDKRMVLVCSQSFQAVIAGLLAVLTISGMVEMWMVYAITLVFGFGLAFDNPARAALAPELVEPEDIPNAVGLNSMLFQGARIVGPAIAGVLIVAVGTGYCFLLNSISFIAVIVALLAMRTGELRRPEPVAREKGQIREGLRYIWGEPMLRSNLLLMVVVGTLAVNSPVILPLLARVTFDGNADTYSVMTIVMGIGALFGAMIVANRGGAGRRLMFTAGLVFGGTMVAAALAPTLPIFLVLLVVLGVGQMAFMGSNSSMIQLGSDPRMRGRVMAVYTVAVMGSTPIGGPFIGWLSGVTSPRVGFAVGGVASVLATLVFARDRVHRARTRRSAPVAQTRRVVGSSARSPLAISATAGTGSGSENSSWSFTSVGRPVASTTHHDASSAMPLGSVK